jgi:hypothetical protein
MAGGETTVRGSGMSDEKHMDQMVWHPRVVVTPSMIEIDNREFTPMAAMVFILEQIEKLHREVSQKEF